jgi:hypothetical protein
MHHRCITDLVRRGDMSTFYTYLLGAVIPLNMSLEYIMIAQFGTVSD